MLGGKIRAARSAKLGLEMASACLWQHKLQHDTLCAEAGGIFQFAGAQVATNVARMLVPVSASRVHAPVSKQRCAGLQI